MSVCVLCPFLSSQVATIMECVCLSVRSRIFFIFISPFILLSSSCCSSSSSSPSLSLPFPHIFISVFSFFPLFSLLLSSPFCCPCIYSLYHLSVDNKNCEFFLRVCICMFFPHVSTVCLCILGESMCVCTFFALQNCWIHYFTIHCSVFLSWFLCGRIVELIPFFFAINLWKFVNVGRKKKFIVVTNKPLAWL